MRHFSRILFLLGATLSSVALSHAQTPTPAPTLTVTDQLVPGSPADHGTYSHWAQFSTTLSASVSNPPQSDDETTISGPTYQWTGGDSVAVLTATTSQTTGLQTPSKPVTELPPGQHSPSVSCTATYTRTDKKDATKTSTSTVSGSLTVKFYSTKPVSLKSLESDPVRGSKVAETYADEGYPSRYEYRQYAQYSFAVLDNQPTAHYYSNGEVHEKFGPTITANPAYRDALLNQGAPGPEATKPNSGGIFTDGNGWTTGDFRQPNKWPQALVDKTTAAGRDDFWYSFTQDWEYVEYPIGSSVAQRTPLQNSHFTISFYRGYVERH